MTVDTVSFPVDLDKDGAQQLLGDLEDLRFASRVQIDFSTLGFAYSLGTLVAAQAIRDFARDRRSENLETVFLTRGLTEPPLSSACSYLSHVGFFRYCKIDHGNAPGAASGSSTYLPITLIRKAELGSALTPQQLADAIKSKSDSLAAMTFKDEDARDLLTYCFTEAIRNALEHAGVDECAVMAQKWAGRRVEIAIIDDGRGVTASLSEGYAGLTAAKALQRAIEPGTSRTRALGPSGSEVNAGFGLYVLSEMGRRYGEFSLWSDDHILQVSELRTLESTAPTVGTALRLVLDTTDAEYFANWFYNTVVAGEAMLAVDAVKGAGPSKHHKGSWL